MQTKYDLAKRAVHKVALGLSGLALVVSTVAGCGTCPPKQHAVLFGCEQNECDCDSEYKSRGKGKYCSDGDCVYCRSDSDCNNGYECEFGSCKWEKQEKLFSPSDFKP
jgi:hypothetical protein